MKFLLVLALAAATLHAQQNPEIPDWAQPGSPTHKQVPPPADFHRPSKIFNTSIGIFEGQADIGSALVPGSASYDPATKQYTIHSAGYNIWYSRDEFRFLWKKVSGDISLAANVSFPDPKGYNDRKAVLVIRQNLDDDSPEAMAGQHGTIGWSHIGEKLEVRLRDISSAGALAECPIPVAPGTELTIDIVGVGPMQGVVRWAQANKFGIQFVQVFDLTRLAQVPGKPQSAPVMRPWYIDQREAG